MKNQKGVSLMELMVIIGIVGVLIFLLIEGNRYMRTSLNISSNEIALNKTISSYIQNIGINIRYYQVTTTAKADEFETLADVSSLPLAWNDKIITSVDQCSTCAGRMGFVITPINSQRGMFRIIVRVYHPDLTSGQIKTYYSVVKGE